MKLELYLLQNMPRCNCVLYQNLVVCSNSSTGIFNPLQSLLKRVDKFCALTPISPKHSTEKRLQPNIWRTNRFATSTSSFQKRFTHWRWSITDRCNATLTFASHGKRQCVMATSAPALTSKVTNSSRFRALAIPITLAPLLSPRLAPQWVVVLRSARCSINFRAISSWPWLAASQRGVLPRVKHAWLMCARISIKRSKTRSELVYTAYHIGDVPRPFVSVRLRNFSRSSPES